MTHDKRLMIVGDRGNLYQRQADEVFANDKGDPSPLAELDPFLAVRFPQGLVLGEQILDDLLLLPVDPPGQNEKEQRAQLIGRKQ